MFFSALGRTLASPTSRPRNYASETRRSFLHREIHAGTTQKDVSPTYFSPYRAAFFTSAGGEARAPRSCSTRSAQRKTRTCELRAITSTSRGQSAMTACSVECVTTHPGCRRFARIHRYVTSGHASGTIPQRFVSITSPATGLARLD